MGISLALVAAADVAHAQSPNPTQAAWQNQWNQTSQTTPFRVPLEMTGVEPYLQPGQLVTAKYAPFASAMTLPKNDAVGVLLPMLSRAVSLQNLFQTGPVTPNTASQHPQWESDGYAVNSCDEWVYKKYYDYRRFQDAAATCGGDPDCVYDVWVMTSTPGENHVMAPKSTLAPWMMPYPTSTLDLDAFQPSQSGSQQQPKNPMRAPNTVQTFLQALALGMENAPDSTSMASFNAVSQYLQSPAFTSDLTYYPISGARSAWHIQMHDQQQSYGMNWLDRKLIQQRIANVMNLVGAYQLADAELGAAVQDWERAVERACGGLATNPHPCTPQMPCKPPPPPSPECLAVRARQPMPTARDEAAVALSQALATEFQSFDRVTGAVDHGCLGTTHNKCDWSPSMIAQEYLTTLDSQAAADLAYCDRIIGTGSAASLADVVPDALQDEVYFGRALADDAQTIQDAKAELSWSQTAPNTVHYDLFGAPSSWSVGGSVAGASYSQSAFWELKGEKSNGQLCRVSGRVVASANASGSVFGNSFTMLDADLLLGVGELAANAADFQGYDAESHLTIGGYSVYDFPEEQINGNMNQQIANTSYDATLLDVPGQISWVSLDIKVQVDASVTANLVATAPQPCSQVSNTMDNQYSLGAKVTPSVSAAGVGTALVGALGTGVGLRGTIDVLTASLPVNVQTGIGPGADDTLALNLDANASLDLDVLSGEIDVAECVLYDCATQELYKWKGIPAFSQVLWNTSYQFPLVSMQDVFQ